MIYRVRCNSFKHCVALAMAFSKHYSNGSIQQPLRDPTVDAGDHRFIFIHEGKPQKDDITADVFVKKYFAQK